jgi:hypothetical protein
MNELCNCQCCKKETNELLKNFRFDSCSELHRFMVCNECFKLNNEEFFPLFYKNKNKI